MTEKELNELKVADIISMPEFREEVDRQLTIEQDAYSKAVMDAKDKGCTLKRFPMLNLRDKGVLNADKMVELYEGVLNKSLVGFSMGEREYIYGVGIVAFGRVLARLKEKIQK